MSKPSVTTATLRKHGIRGVFADMNAALIGHAYDWRLAGNADASKLTNEFADRIQNLVNEYRKAIGEITSR